jgi:hypothetical protein
MCRILSTSDEKCKKYGKLFICAINKITAISATFFTKLNTTQRNYVEIWYTHFHPNPSTGLYCEPDDSIPNQHILCSKISVILPSTHVF